MAKKRKSDASGFDEVERNMYSTFCSAANSLSQIYTQSMNQQKLSFHAGERHALEKLYQWILRRHEETSRVTLADIAAYMQHELDYGEDDAHNLHPQPSTHSTNSTITNSSGSSRATHLDQTKDSVFTNALLSPIRQSLQTYHEANSSNHNKGTHPSNSSMDMH